mgnify:CR=1 FL=1
MCRSQGVVTRGQYIRRLLIAAGHREIVVELERRGHELMAEAYPAVWYAEAVSGNQSVHSAGENY